MQEARNHELSPACGEGVPVTASASDDLAPHIPHRGLMHWLDHARMEGDVVVATRRITAGHPFVRQGFLLRSALLEMVSQAAACEAVASARAAGRAVQGGMLVGIRDFRISGCPRTGQTIELRSRRERTMGPLVLCAVEARIDGALIATGRMTFHLTLE
jgi:hypothetical protein